MILDDDEFEIRVCHDLILFLIAMIVRISDFCLQRETAFVGAFSSIQLRYSFGLETEGREMRRLDHRERSFLLKQVYPLYREKRPTLPRPVLVRAQENMVDHFHLLSHLQIEAVGTCDAKFRHHTQGVFTSKGKIANVRRFCAVVLEPGGEVRLTRVTRLK